MPPRLLLLEFATALRQRTDRAQFFPFWKGWAQARGAPSLWLCAGGHHRAWPSPDGRFVMRVALDPPDSEALLAEVRAFAPSHVVTNEVLDEELRAELARALPSVAWIDATYLATDVPEIARLVPAQPVAPGGTAGDHLYGLMDESHRSAWFADWLGLPRDPTGAEGKAPYLVEAAAPVYDARLVNELARRREPMIRLLGGSFCLYRKSLRDNPRYAGVDLSTRLRDYGCAFCPIRLPPVSGPGDDPLALVERQLRALADSGPHPRDMGHYDVYDMRLFLRVDELVDLLVRLQRPPSTLCFSPRIDQVLGARARIERALPVASAHGHTLRLLRIGAESFSDTEQARYNKGISAAQIDEALALFQAWQERWPRAFDPALPLAFISFTPWTTLDDVEQALARGARHGLHPAGRWLHTTLELDAQTPITALAEAEGHVLVDRYPDASQAYASSAMGTWRRDQRPWRFLDERVAAYHAIVTRLCAASVRDDYPDTAFDGDPLYAWLAELADRLYARDATPLAVAQGLTGILRAAEPPFDRRTLAEQAFRACVSEGRAGTSPDERLRRVAREIVRHRADTLPGVQVAGARVDVERRRGALALLLDGRPFRAFVAPLGAGHPLWLCGESLGLGHDPETPPAPGDEARLRRLLSLIERAAPRHLPEIA